MAEGGRTGNRRRSDERTATWRWMAMAIGVVLTRPHLWRTALVQARRLTPSGWWRRPPFLPVPDRSWLGFRLQTMYGRSDASPDAAALVHWLEWARRVDRLR